MIRNIQNAIVNIECGQGTRIAYSLVTAIYEQPITARAFAFSSLASADEVTLSITIETDTFGVFQPNDVLGGAVSSLNNAGTHLNVTSSAIEEIIYGEQRTVLALTRCLDNKPR